MAISDVGIMTVVISLHSDLCGVYTRYGEHWDGVIHLIVASTTALSLYRKASMK